MSNLDNDAYRQSARDASAKLYYGRGFWRFLLDWYLARSFKAKFTLAVIVALPFYAAVLHLLIFLGLRDPVVVASVKRDCNSLSMSSEERGQCVWEQREKERLARAAAQKGEDKRLKELGDETERRRRANERADELDRKATKEKFESNIDSISVGQVRFSDHREKTKFREETLDLIVMIITSTQGHPAHNTWPSLRYKYPRPGSGARELANYFKSEPDAEREVHKYCVDGFMKKPPGWREDCGATLKRNVLRLRPTSMDEWGVDILLRN